MELRKDVLTTKIKLQVQTLTYDLSALTLTFSGSTREDVEQNLTEATAPTPQPARVAATRIETEYHYKIVWSTIEEDTIKAFDLAENNKEEAHPNKVDEFKLQLGKDIVADYKVWRAAHPGSQKHPPIKALRQVSEQVSSFITGFAKYYKRETLKNFVYIIDSLQVFNKYKTACIVKLNNTVMGDGMSGFTRNLEICIQNLLRKDTTTLQRPKKKAVGRGTVGVLLEKYNPKVLEREEQVKLMEELQQIHKEDPQLWDLDKISRMMTDSYSLLRDEIIDANIQIAEGPQDEDDPDIIRMQVLKNNWPYLFEPRWLQEHHAILTGKDLAVPLEDFLEKIGAVLLFLGASGEGRAKNLALRVDLEQRGNIIERQAVKLHLAVMMTVNNFKEDINNLIKTAEVRNS